jgi:3-hydroxyacyl-CoA dehydrogenase
MKCLDEGVAGSDRELAEKQIDLGTVMGIGFPPFRGGVLHFAHSRGLALIHSKLSELERRFGSRYSPFSIPGEWAVSQ